MMAIAGVVVLGAASGWGCGETGDTDPTPVRTFKITPAAGGSAATPAPQASPTRPAAQPASPGAGTTITIAGLNNEFDIEEVEVPAGTVTVVFDNRDSGVVHNIHFFEGDDDDGESVAETEIEAGPLEQTLTFDVEPGEYFYQCDAHPTTMTGTLLAN
jgi:plastocyanin